MKKIPTLFVRDPEDRKHVLREVTPGCEWVLAGEGVPTRKYDGTCVLIDVDGSPWARREVKPGKEPPSDYRVEEHDEVTGKTVGWEPMGQSAFARWFDEAEEVTTPGTYELCGPKINGNPEGFGRHVLVSHGVEMEPIGGPQTFDSLRAFLTAPEYRHEGIVWHHPDGRMVKLKRRDFPRA